MPQIAFYHLTKSSLEQALPLLLSKTLEAGKRAVVMVDTAKRAEALNNALWTQSSGWLPHGSAKDGEAERQPIWLTDSQENLNDASFVFLADGVECEDLSAYERCFELFDGVSPEAVQTARSHWKAYKDQGYDLTYWQQTNSGGWQKKDT